MRVQAVLLVATLLTSGSELAAQERSYGRSMVISKGGIVAASQTLAAQAGAQILSRGGSAVDAAIATNAVLGLVEPMMCGIGGDLFAIYRDAKSGKLTGLNSSGPAPKAMSIAWLKSKGEYAMPSTAFTPSLCPAPWRGGPPCTSGTGSCPGATCFNQRSITPETGFPLPSLSSGIGSKPRGNCASTKTPGASFFPEDTRPSR